MNPPAQSNQAQAVPSHPAAPATAGETHAPPDWSAVETDPHCPLCEYNLRGLVTPRCPECGYHFEWPEVLNPRRENHPYLFEHHPERNVWSYGRTVTGACLPRRFWNRLHPSQKSQLGRLILYWLIGVFALAMSGTCHVVADAHVYASQANQLRAEEAARLRDYPGLHQALVVLQFGSIQQYLDANYPRGTIIGELKDSWESGEALRIYEDSGLLLTAVALSWFVLTFGSLLIFQLSMRRARIKATHVLRCVIYSFDPMVWAAGLVIVIPGACFWYGASLDSEMLVGSSVLAMGALALWSSYRLYIAYCRYLRFSHPLLTVLASQIIVVLALMNAFLIPVLLF